MQYLNNLLSELQPRAPERSLRENRAVQGEGPKGGEVNLYPAPWGEWGTPSAAVAAGLWGVSVGGSLEGLLNVKGEAAAD